MFSSLLQGLIVATMTAGGAEAPPDDSANYFELLGVRVCMAEPSDAKPCHLRLFAANQSDKDQKATKEEPVPMQLSVFGKRICLGPVPADAPCDLRFGPTDRSGTEVSSSNEA